MPGICAILHTHNDARRLGRALETLRACDEVIVIDRGSGDCTLDVAREYGARVVSWAAEPRPSQTEPAAILALSACDWLLTLSSDESISELLEAELYEWRLAAPPFGLYSLEIREQDTGGEWHVLAPEPRLLHRSCFADPQHLHTGNHRKLLQGSILRFSFPK